MQIIIVFREQNTKQAINYMYTVVVNIFIYVGKRPHTTTIVAVKSPGYSSQVQGIGTILVYYVVQGRTKC